MVDLVRATRLGNIENLMLATSQDETVRETLFSFPNLNTKNNEDIELPSGRNTGERAAYLFMWCFFEVVPCLSQTYFFIGGHDGKHALAPAVRGLPSPILVSTGAVCFPCHRVPTHLIRKMSSSASFARARKRSQSFESGFLEQVDESNTQARS